MATWVSVVGAPCSWWRRHWQWPESSRCRPVVGPPPESAPRRKSECLKVRSALRCAQLIAELEHLLRANGAQRLHGRFPIVQVGKSTADLVRRDRRLGESAEFQPV